MENFKHILRQNIIQNCPVTTKDVDIAEKIFGKDIAALKGKGVRRTPRPAVADFIEIPKELVEQHRSIELCIDIMFACGIPMLTSIDRTIRYRSLNVLQNRSADELYRALDCILRAYNKAGFFIERIYADQEFKPNMAAIIDNLDIEINFTSTDEHVPEAERNNRTLQERIRAIFHSLPFDAVPEVMIRHMATEAAIKLNLFPAKGGISAYLSPHVLLGGVNWDYKKHCQHEFGSYVMADYEGSPKNNNVSRKLDAIYLHPLRNIQGGHEVMSLHTGRVRTVMRVTAVPMTETA